MLKNLPKPLLYVLRFIRRVVSRFLKNKGILLAGAVGYNALLSLVPLFAILLIVLSHIFDERLILSAVDAELSVVIPGQADTLVASLAAFLESRSVISGIGLVVLLFFSSIAFRILNDAMAIIFHKHKPQPRHPLISAILPYMYIGLMGLGLVGLTITSGIISALGESTFLAIGTYEKSIYQVLGFIGLTLMLTSIYLVMPPVKVSFRRALAGGFTAAVLWEIVRNVMVWYFDNLSMVDVIYGSLGTVIVVLLSMEVAAIIILLGAQVIAELERAAQLGLPWYIDADLPQYAHLTEQLTPADDAPSLMPPQPPTTLTTPAPAPAPASEQETAQTRSA